MKAQVFIGVALLFLSAFSLAGVRYDCTMKNNTGWPTAFYLGGGDVINLQHKDTTAFDCSDLEGLVKNQLKSLDGRTLTIQKTGPNQYSVTSTEALYPH